MKPNLLIPLLLLSLLLFQAQGIHLSILHQESLGLNDILLLAHEILKLEIDSVQSEKKRASSASKKSSDGFLPSIHEDYYGPRNHKPRHHKH
ncbi:hypothetical protein BT93_C0211 [Corymbia citriodora subsp. variegata]|nr:hypothetical protein BT93_C0211 [Corymbia citriodora subsp. variegata]